MGHPPHLLLNKYHFFYLLQCQNSEFKKQKKEKFEKLSDITMKTWSKRIEDQLSTYANYCTYKQRKLTLEVTVFSRRKEKYANDYMKWAAQL